MVLTGCTNAKLSAVSEPVAGLMMYSRHVLVEFATPALDRCTVQLWSILLIPTPCACVSSGDVVISGTPTADEVLGLDELQRIEGDLTITGDSTVRLQSLITVTGTVFIQAYSLAELPVSLLANLRFIDGALIFQVRPGYCGDACMMSDDCDRRLINAAGCSSLCWSPSCVHALILHRTIS